MAATAMLEKFQVTISPQRLTIFLYSAHRAVVFAIAQLSCLCKFSTQLGTVQMLRCHRGAQVAAVQTPQTALGD